MVYVVFASLSLTALSVSGISVNCACKDRFYLVVWCIVVVRNAHVLLQIYSCRGASWLEFCVQQHRRDIWPCLCVYWQFSCVYLCMAVCLFSLYIFINEYSTLPVCRLAAAEGSGPRCMREEEEESSEEEEQLSPEEQGGLSGLLSPVPILVLHWSEQDKQSEKWAGQ